MSNYRYVIEMYYAAIGDDLRHYTGLGGGMSEAVVALMLGVESRGNVADTKELVLTVDSWKAAAMQDSAEKELDSEYLNLFMRTTIDKLVSQITGNPVAPLALCDAVNSLQAAAVCFTNTLYSTEPGNR